MTDHVNEWLGAYHDGELHGARRLQVEQHLQGCAACRAELGALAALSTRLHQTAEVPARTPAGQFVAQVRLRLRPRPAPASGLVGWLLLGGLVGLWVVLQTVLVIGRAALVVTEMLGAPLWPQAFTGQSAVQLLALDAGFSALVGALTWSWLAGWWAARSHQQRMRAMTNG